MRIRFGVRSVLVVLALASIVVAAPPPAPSEWSLFGDAAVVSISTRPSRSAFELTSSTTVGDGYGGMSYVPARTITFAQLTQLSADYRALEGGVGGGSPRFSIGLDLNGDGVFQQAADGSGPDGNVFVGPGDLSAGYTGPVSTTWQNTGNFITSPDFRWDASQCGGTGWYDDYTTVRDLVGTKQVMYVLWVTDGGWLFGDQVVQCNNITVNRSVLSVK